MSDILVGLGPALTREPPLLPNRVQLTPASGSVDALHVHTTQRRSHHSFETRRTDNFRATTFKSDTKYTK
jgi:hypothetical protein